MVVPSLPDVRGAFCRRCRLQRQVPRFGDEAGAAEAVVRLAADTAEAGLPVEAPGRREVGLRPQRDPAVAGGPREADAFVDQAAADAEAARATARPAAGAASRPSSTCGRGTRSRPVAARARRSSSARGPDRSGRGNRRRCRATSASNSVVAAPLARVEGAVALRRPSPCRPAGAAAADRRSARPRRRRARRAAAGSSPSPRPAAGAARAGSRSSSAATASRRARLERREGGASFRGQARAGAGARRRRRGAARQPLRFEAAQDAAQIAGVEAEIAAEIGRGRRLAVRELVEDAHLGQRERAVEQAIAERADAAGVEAVERAHRIDRRSGRHHDHCQPIG